MEILGGDKRSRPLAERSFLLVQIPYFGYVDGATEMPLA